MAKRASIVDLDEGAPAPPQNPDKMRALKEKLSEARLLERDIEDLSEQLRGKQERMTALRTKELPAMFEELGMDSFGLVPEGNLPGYDVEVSPFFSANVTNMPPEGQVKAFALLRKLGVEDIIKNTFTVPFGRGEEAKARKLEAALKKLKLGFDRKVSVHGTVLTAEIRRRFKSGKPLSPSQMATLGAFAGKVVNMKKRED